MRIVYSALARRDLQTIRAYTLETFGTEQAKRYLLQIRADCEAVAAGRKPTRVLALPHVTYRFHASSSHVVYHRSDGEMLSVVRVLHRRMQIEDHL